MNTGTMRAQGVCKSFGKKAVLRELELTLEPGKIYGLLGRNGAGKTTLLSILTAQLALSGAASPTAGSRCGRTRPRWTTCASPGRPPPPDRPASGWDIISALPPFSIPAGTRAMPTAAWGVLPGSSRKLLPLSRGQLSMVSVLTAALTRRLSPPSLDEPTAGLDAVAREQFLPPAAGGLLPHRAHLRPVHPHHR